MTVLRKFGEDHDLDDDRPSILVLGVGGAGRNIVEEIKDISSKNLKIYEVGTSSRPPKLPYISISKEEMKQAYHSDLELDERPLTRSEKKLRGKIKGFDITYIIAGLGGRTGSWTVPVCAEICDNYNSLVFGFFAKPFDSESCSRKKLADRAQNKAQEHLDISAIFPNSKLLDIDPHLPIKKAFGVMNKIMRIPIIDLNSVITDSDIEPLNKICRGTEDYRIGAGYGKGMKKGLKAAKEAMRSPWLAEFKSYNKILTIITTGVEKLDIDIEDALEEIENNSPGAEIIFGVRKDQDLKERIRVTIIAGK